MPRIRTIKPEFWDSPATGAASLRARLFYIAMWNWADDYGVGTAQPAQLLAFAFPHDGLSPSEFPSLAKEVADRYGVTFYSVRGRDYYSVPTWDRHQRTERKANRSHPGPDDPAAEPKTWPDLQSGGTSDATQGRSATTQGSSPQNPPLEQGKGNRGTGEVPPTAAPTSGATQGELVAIQGEIVPAPTTTGDDAPDTAGRMIGDWIDACKHRPPARVVGQVGKELRAMLADGMDPAVVRTGFIEWHQRGLHPSTLASVVHELANSPKRAGNNPRGDDFWQRAAARMIGVNP